MKERDDKEQAEAAAEGAERLAADEAAAAEVKKAADDGTPPPPQGGLAAIASRSQQLIAEAEARLRAKVEANREAAAAQEKAKGDVGANADAAPDQGAAGATSSAAAPREGEDLRRGPIRRFLAGLTLRAPVSATARLVAMLACLAIIFLVWTLVTLGDSVEDRIVSSTLLPSPAETVAAFKSLWFESALTRNLIASLWRVAQGFGLATLIGVPMGIAAGTWPRFAAFIAPISVFGRNVPISALVPITMVWFGIDEMQKIMFIFIACVMFVVFDAARAVADVHDRYVQTALTLGASPLQVLLKVLVPLAAPTIFGSLRLLFGLAFGYIIVAEMVNAEYGLGHLILVAQRRGPLAHVYLILVVITAVAYLIDRALVALGHWLFPYKEA